MLWCVQPVWSGLSGPAGVGVSGQLALSAPAAGSHGRFTYPYCADSTSQDEVEVGSSSPVHSFSADGCFKLIHGVKFGVVSREAVEFKSGEL